MLEPFAKKEERFRHAMDERVRKLPQPRRQQRGRGRRLGGGEGEGAAGDAADPHTLTLLLPRGDVFNALCALLGERRGLPCSPRAAAGPVQHYYDLGANLKALPRLE